MKRTILPHSFLLLAGCTGNEAALNESDIANRASAISDSANATVDAQIADIEQKAVEGAATDPAKTPTNIATATDATGR
jgi:hypothetical protein